MTVNDPTAQDPLAQNARRSRRSRLADVVATIVLLTVHFCLFGRTILVLALPVLNIDTCGYQKWGDSAWLNRLNRAIDLGLWAGGVILLADLAVAVLRLARRRVTWFVPVIGCLAQLAVGFGATTMESLAGPVW